MSSIIREMAFKCTKSKVNKVLTFTWGIYLPPVDQISWDFIRDLLSVDKLVSPFSSPLKNIERNRVKTIDVPILMDCVKQIICSLHTIIIILKDTYLN